MHIPSKNSAYRTNFDETKCMSFLIKGKKLSEKYNLIWKKISNITKTKFDSNPAYNQKYVKIKIKSYNEKINTNFNNNKIPKEGSISNID